MSGIDTILDSNVLIYLSKGDLSTSEVESFGKRFGISVITLMEVKGHKFKSVDEKNFIEELCDVFDVVYIDAAIADKVIELRRQLKIKLPDAIIAATALVLDATVVTNDLKHFRSVLPSNQLAAPEIT